MRSFALLLLPLLLSSAAHGGNPKIIKLGSLTIECFFPECDEKLKEVDGFVAESGIQGLGNIVTIAFSNWWSKPTVGGRVIVNMYDRPEIIISYLERHGSAARNAIYDARDIAEELNRKYGIDLTCERRTLATRCAEVAKQIREALTLADNQGLKPLPQSMDIVAIDWNVDKSTPKAIIFGALKEKSRRYQIKDVLSLQDVQQGFAANKIYFAN